MLLSFYPIHLLGFIIKKHSERLLLSSASFGFSDLSQIFCRLIPTLVCRVQNESAQACFTMLWDASVCHLCLTKWQHRVNGLCLCHENKRQRNKATAAREDLSVFLLKGGGGAAKGEKDRQLALVFEPLPSRACSKCSFWLRSPAEHLNCVQLLVCFMELMSESVQPWGFWKLAGTQYGGGEVGAAAGM